MRVLIIFLLAAVAGWLVVPGLIRRHREASVTASVSAFQAHISLLATRLGPAAEPLEVARPPRTPRRVIIARTLATATAAGIVCAALAGGWWWLLPGAAFSLFAAYLALLRSQRGGGLRGATVHRLPARQEPLAPPVLLDRRAQ